MMKRHRAWPPSFYRAVELVAELERVQKVLARAGLGSRREVERWITEGRISVNGKIVALGAQVGVEDRLQVDGRLISTKDLLANTTRVIVYNKPVGEICTRRDPENRPTVFNRLPRLQSGRWIVVGRLDINTSGLLLFTTDGELANQLMHPSSEVDREYAVRVMGQVEPDALERMKGGVMLEDGEACFTDITLMKNKKEEAINQWFYCSLKEGRNREVRRLWESQGYKVSRLKRVRFGRVHLLAKVKEGSSCEMTEKEVKSLYEDVDLEPKRVEKTIAKRQSKEKIKRQDKHTKRTHIKSQPTTRGVSKGRRRK